MKKTFWSHPSFWLFHDRICYTSTGGKVIPWNSVDLTDQNLMDFDGNGDPA